MAVTMSMEDKARWEGDEMGPSCIVLEAKLPIIDCLSLWILCKAMTNKRWNKERQSLLRRARDDNQADASWISYGIVSYFLNDGFSIFG